MDQNNQFTPKQKKWIVGVGLGLFLILFSLAAYFAGKPLVAFASRPEEFRAWLERQGVWGPLLFSGMMVLQVIVAVIPGGPLQIAAGYAFGIWWGTVISVLSTVLAGALVFLAVRKWGVKIVDLFFSIEQVRSLPILRDQRKLHFWLFILMLIPGTPKDLLSYAVGLTSMPLSHWVVISLIARTPAIAASTISGNALGTENYIVAAVTLAVTAVLAGLGLLVYRHLAPEEKSE